MKPAWIFGGLYPWFPKQAALGVGPLTDYPVETGWIPTADLYYSPKALICAASYSFAGGGAGGAGTIVGAPRCNRARELIRAKPATFGSDAFPVLDSTGAPVGNTVRVDYDSFSDGVPRSKFDNDRHYARQVCSGYFSIGSSVEHFTSTPGPNPDPATLVGTCEVVANPGKQSIFVFPLYRTGPLQLIDSINVQIFRQPWAFTEL